MKDRILVVEAKRQQGIVQKLLVKKAGFLWMLKISEDATAYRLLVYEEVFEEIIGSIEEKVSTAKLDWYESK